MFVFIVEITFEFSPKYVPPSHLKTKPGPLHCMAYQEKFFSLVVSLLQRYRLYLLCNQCLDVMILRPPLFVRIIGIFPVVMILGPLPGVIAI